MATPRPQSTAFAPVLLAIRAKLDADIFNSEGYCYIGRVDSTNPAYIAERFIAVTPGGVECKTFANAGVWALPMERKVVITLCTRLSIDIAGQLQSAFTDVLYGHMYLEEQIINSLQIFNVRNEEDTDNLLSQPMHLSEINASYSIDENVPTKDMLMTQLTFTCNYLFYTTREI